MSSRHREGRQDRGSSPAPFHALLDSKIFDNLVLDLFKTVMIGIKDFTRSDYIPLDADFFCHGRKNGIDVIAHNSGFSAHRAHILELFDLRSHFFECFLGQFSDAQLFFDLINLVAAVFALTSSF